MNRLVQTWCTFGWHGLLMLSLCTAMIGCYSSHELATGGRVTDPSPIDDGMVVGGYVTTDGTFHEFRGRVWSSGSDSLEFVADPSSITRLEDPVRLKLARSDVKALEVRQLSVGASVGAVVLLGAALTAMVLFGLLVSGI